jgi:excinuclease ABC subunit C
MKISFINKKNLPDTPGVYIFLGGSKKKKILYIGKATSIRSRVKSYFSKDLIETRGPHIIDMVFKSSNLEWVSTNSVLEALVLEAHLIKKNQPYYNTKEKDDKSFNYVVITDESVPQVSMLRGRDLEKNLKAKNFKLKAVFGPFTSGSLLKEALKIIRRIFPYIDKNSIKKDNYEFYKQLRLSPDIKNDNGALGEYLKNIKNIKLFFEGKTKNIISSLKKEMLVLAKKQEFEKANEIKRKIFALEHIKDTALMKNDYSLNKTINTGFRIEAYDVAHMSGKNMVGVMTVVLGDNPETYEYKKFIVKSQSNANDTGALEEILSRRFRHTEWGIPDLIVTDGGLAQMQKAIQVLKRYQFDIPVVSIVKDDRHKAKGFLGEKEIIQKHKQSILLANSEAHRFAIRFHKEKRSKQFLPS